MDVENFSKFFDIDTGFIERLKKRKGISVKSQEIYDYYGVTPLIILDKLSSYTDKDMNRMLSSIFLLDKAIRKILKVNDCIYPFENNTVNYILIKELYENFLDHFREGIFDTPSNFSFVSLSLTSKFNEREGNNITQANLQRNLKEEYPREFDSFLKTINLMRLRISRLFNCHFLISVWAYQLP